MGTTALALITHPKEEYWVFGDEHYLDVLKSFVTFSYLSHDFIGDVYFMAFIPVEKFSEEILQYLCLYQRARRTEIIGYRKEIELQMKNQLFVQILESKHSGAILFIDSFGKILSASQSYFEWFGVKAEKTDIVLASGKG
ncbi:MAG: hypothetical protein PHF03_02130 [Syntrophomonadaceae bacterium]|nr:hypothetical protein [Syntrophomonadaceae bacterium]MDD4803137.1 hypothetical protein [Syntrophomonas sp.]